MFDFISRDAHAGMQVPHPFRMDIVGPYWLERLCFGEVQKYRDGPKIIASRRKPRALHAVYHRAIPVCRNTRHAVRSASLPVASRKQEISAADARRYTPMQCAGLKTAD
jgi:hypothetical protein